MIDYFMVRRENLGELKNCKVIPGSQLKTAQDAGHGDEGCQEKDESKRERTKQTRWWKLNEEEVTDAFISKAREHLVRRRRKINKLEGDIF